MVGELTTTRGPAFERVLSRLRRGVIVVDRDLTVQYANPAARRILGPDVAVEDPRPLPDPWPELSLRAYASHLFDDPTDPPSEIFATSDERSLAVEGIAAAGLPTAILILEDVTVAQRERRAEHEFVANAAHELRTPVGAIASAIEVLQAGAKEDPSDRDRFLAHIERQSARLARLTSSLLVLARAQAGTQAPRLELTEIEPILRDIAQHLETAPEVRLEVRAESGVAALVDRELAHHALWNVAANAATHTYEGTIVLEAREAGPVAEVEVRDTGRGMTPTERQRAFERFYSAAGRSGDGFGLGLAIAETAVRALGGTIALASKPDEGTAVRISLPAAHVVGR